MHNVKTPQKRETMREHVPQVQRVIQEHDGERDFEPHGQPHAFEQSPTATLDQSGERFDNGSLRELKRGGADGGHRKVARLARELWFNRTPQRATAFQPQQRAERAQNERRAHPRWNVSRLHKLLPIESSLWNVAEKVRREILCGNILEHISTMLQYKHFQTARKTYETE